MGAVSAPFTLTMSLIAATVTMPLMLRGLLHGGVSLSRTPSLRTHAAAWH